MRIPARRFQFFMLLLLLLAASAISAQVAKTPESDDRPGREGMVVAIDKATGQLRQPTADEAAVLTAPQRTPLRQLKVGRTAGGAVMIELDETFLDYFTVRLGEDGGLHALCTHADQVDTILRLPVRTAPVMEEK